MGCGYHLVQSAPACQVASISDETGEGDLGLLAAQRLRARLSHSDACTLSGRVKLRSEDPLGYDDGGVPAYRVVVQLQLDVTRDASQALICVGESVYGRGVDLEHSDAARRAGLKAAVESAADQALLRLGEL